MKSKDLISILDLALDDIGCLIDLAADLKVSNAPTSLAGRTVALLFEKPSLRTRVSFDVGIHHLGAHPLYMGGPESQLGVREPVADLAQVLTKYVDCIVARVKVHASLQELAENASIPVVNALSDWEHPCQTLADLLTIKEIKGRLNGVSIAYIGDGNNVARSLTLGAASVGANISIASPSGYGLDAQTLELARQRAAEWTTTVTTSQSAVEAISKADVVYTDVWTSMGQESEREVRLKAFAGYSVDEQLMLQASPKAILMHPMPAHYGEEIPYGMLNNACSAAFLQAENRLHSHKAVLYHLIGGRRG